MVYRLPLLWYWIQQEEDKLEPLTQSTFILCLNQNIHLPSILTKILLLDGFHRFHCAHSACYFMVHILKFSWIGISWFTTQIIVVATWTTVIRVIINTSRVLSVILKFFNLLCNITNTKTIGRLWNHFK